MSKVTSNVRYNGTLYNVTYARVLGEDIARQKSSLSKETILTDPKFQRTRENMQEFGNAATGGKLIRGAFRPITLGISDSRVSSRLQSVLSAVQKKDTTNARGERTVDEGLATSGGKALLTGRNFNIGALLGSILQHPFIVDMPTFTVDINNLVPINGLLYPVAATHFSVQAGFANIDFATGVVDFQPTGIVNNPIDGSAVSISLTPATTPTGSGYDLAVLAITFYQEVNGVQYALKDHSYDAAAIVGIV